MILRPKHILLTILGLILAAGIFYVNYIVFVGNTLGRCLYLSTFTFLFWWLTWALYFELRDFWQFRWYGPHIDVHLLEMTPLTIPLSAHHANRPARTLGGEYISRREGSSEGPIVVFSHGFSDDSVYVRHITGALVLAGYDVVAYDNRGTKKSRNAGSSADFVGITEDLADVIAFIKDQPYYRGRPLYLIGFSLGAIAAVKQGLAHPPSQVQKVVAVAAMANYRDALPYSPVPFLKRWWFWLRYLFFGVPINPLPPINEALSPLLLFRQKRASAPDSEAWEKIIQNRFFFIHAQNDNVISFRHLWENLHELGLNPHHWLLTKRGGHNFLQYEPMILSKILYFLALGPSKKEK